jgi:hypothetical protein
MPWWQRLWKAQSPPFLTGACTAGLCSGTLSEHTVVPVSHGRDPISADHSFLSSLFAISFPFMRVLKMARDGSRTGSIEWLCKSC